MVGDTIKDYHSEDLRRITYLMTCKSLEFTSIVFVVMRRLIRIHVWGGFGSQLNGIALQMFLEEEGRRCILIFHSSGITERLCEVQNLLRDVKWIQLHDYKQAKDSTHNHDLRSSSRRESTLRLTISFKSIAKLFLQHTRLILYPNGVHDLQRIKPWTLGLRGHYSHIQFNNSVYERLLKKLLSTFPDPNPSRLAIHYRHGDLKNSGKPWVGMKSIERILSQLHFAPSDKLRIFSDSADSTVDLVGSRPGLNWEPVEVSMHIGTILSECIGSEIFVGTTSKISLWASFFRSTKPVNYQKTWLPTIIKEEYRRCFGTDTLNSIRWYGESGS